LKQWDDELDDDAGARFRDGIVSAEQTRRDAGQGSRIVSDVQSVALVQPRTVFSLRWPWSTGLSPS